jgi:DNA polymerase-1
MLQAVPSLGCSNCYYLSPKVGTRGPEDSPFVIVGESPGIDEVIEGAPFVGASGTVINETLEKMGVQRLRDKGIEPYFTNAIHCLPRRKDPENLAAACTRCRPRLLQELRKHPRKVILSLGGPAIQTLTTDFSLKITKVRGRLWKSDLCEVGIVSAVHPAFLLRGGGNYQQFERDVKYAIELMLHGEDAKRLPDGTTYSVASTIEDVNEIVHEIQTMDIGQCASDIETTGFNYMSDRLLYVGFQTKPKTSYIVPGHLLQPGLFDAKIRYTWHNGKFDVRWLRHLGYKARVDDDSLLLNYTLNERRGIHDLDQVSSDWLGSVNHKHLVDYIYKQFVIDEHTKQKRRGNLSDLEPSLVHRYLALDLADTYNLKNTLKPKVLADPNLKRFYEEHLIPGSEYLTRLEMNGMLVDEEWVVRNHYRLQAEIDKYEAEINAVAEQYLGHPINPRSWQQVKKLFYTTLKLGHMGLSTSEEQLKKLPQVPVVKSLLNHREVAKSHGTYVKPLLYGPNRDLIDSKKITVVFPDGRVHPNYLLHGTPTSRLACRDPNVQNIPRDPKLRGQFKARDGYGIIECDYSQAELRSLAALSRCKALMEVFQKGWDLHNELTTFLFGKNWTREDKMKAKTINFGIPYGREANSIAEAFKVPVEEAQSWIDGWAERFPGAWDFIQRCRNAPAMNQTIVTCFGNKKRPGVVSRDKLKDLQNESANFPHQSIASNLTIRAGIELIDPLEHRFDTYIINTVHDCIVAEVPLNLPHILAVAKFMRGKMEEIATRYEILKVVPFKAEAEFGHHWGNLVKVDEIANQSTCYLHSIPKYIPAH